MHLEKLEIDSSIFGRSVLTIYDFSEQLDFDQFEQDYILQYDPVYVSCKIPIENISEVHALENHGFHFVEFQIKSTIKIKGNYPTAGFPYIFERIDTEEKLEPVLDIAKSTFEYDRFTIDPLLGKEISGERYKQYVLKSFQSADERVYRLYNPSGNETLAIKTHKYLGGNEVLFLLGGVHPKYKNTGIGALNGYYELNELYKNGIKRGYTHISGGNYPVFNIEFGKIGFKIIAAFVVMRKIYLK